MPAYRYTELDDLQEVIRIAFDKSESVERRTMAIVDLSILRNEHDKVFYRLLEMAGDTAEHPAVRGIVFDQISFFWDEQAVPVLLRSLQDESVEVRFWAAFATTTIRHHISDAYASQLIPLLDTLVSRDDVYKGYWHAGREAIEALEEIYYKKIVPTSDRNGATSLISPMPEYVNFRKSQRDNISIPETSPLNIDPDWLKYHLRQRFDGIQFNVRRPRLRCYQLDWQIETGKQQRLGALHRDGYGLILTRYGAQETRRFARWYRLLFSSKIPLYLYEWAAPGLELKHGMSLAEIRRKAGKLRF